METRAEEAGAGGLPHATCGSADRGNAQPLLNELRHALERLLQSGEETVIDLARLPLGPADEAALEEALGRGEVSAVLDAMGESRVEETAFPGVWRITHRDEGGQFRVRLLSVCWIPDILRAQREDMEEGLQRLEEQIADAVSGVAP